MIYKKKFPHVSKFRIKKLNKKRISEKKNNNYSPECLFYIF